MKLATLLSATALAGSLFLTPTIASAQTGATTSTQEADQAAAENDEGTGSHNEITVVGSRIRRSNLTSADPVTVITREETTSAGFNSTAEALQSTAVTGGTSQINNSYGGYVTAGGPGANTLSLRGLGATRSLILLNGRRISPSGSRGQVGAGDLTVLPNAMLDRIEVLNTGASSVYGSDAIAGVVNLVTRNDINGIILEAQHNVPEIGVGVSKRYSAVFGTKAGAFNIAGSLEYTDRDRVTFGDVDFTRCQYSLRRTAANPALGSASFVDPLTGQPKCYGEASVTGASGTTINTIGVPGRAGGTVALAPGVPTGYTGTCDRFRPRAGAGGALPGFECVGGGTLNIGIRDLLPASLFQSDLVSGGELYNGFLQASYDVGPVEIYGELLANRRNSEQIGNRQLVIDYAQGSPLIPAGPLRSTTAFLPAQAGGITGTTPIGVRLFTDYGTYGNRQKVDFVRGLVGARGDLFGDWRFDAYVMRSWSDASYTSDLVLTTKLAQSLDVVASGSGFACRNTLGGCVAAPAITNAVIGGQFPRDWIDYITDEVTGTTKYRETIANVTFDGSFFDLPGGKLAGAVGFEYRKMSIDDTPDVNSQSNNLYSFTSSSITRGEDSVKEVFGELEAPIFSDVPFAYRLTLNGSARYTDYESYGSQTTYKVGALWAPTKYLSFRGSYGTSYRAPALYEQFLGATSGFQSQNGDPCNNYGALDATSNRYQNCASLGLPGTYTATSSIQVNQRGGAETGLSAETSRAYTFGAVFEPELGDFGRFSLSADYFNVKVDNGVAQLGYSTILTQCYDSPTADFNARADTCALITRGTAAPYTLQVLQGYVNISTSQVSGIDFTGRYSIPVGDGTFRLNANVTKFIDRYSRTLPTDPTRNVIGSVNNPEWSGTFEAAYNVDRWTLRYGVEWLDATSTSAFQLGTTDATLATYYFQTPDYFLHSASVRYAGEHFGVVMGVRNLTNSSLPEISSGSYNRVANVPLYSGYDYVGRTFFINVTTAF